MSNLLMAKYFIDVKIHEKKLWIKTTFWPIKIVMSKNKIIIFSACDWWLLFIRVWSILDSSSMKWPKPVYLCIYINWILGDHVSIKLSYKNFQCTSIHLKGVLSSDYNEGDLDSIPGLGRSPGEGNGNPAQYSCLENPMDGGTW